MYKGQTVKSMMMRTSTISTTDHKNIETKFSAFVQEGAHPCIMAKSVFKMKNYDMHTYGDMHTPECITTLLDDIKTYISNVKHDTMEFRSFIAVFPNNHFSDEVSFENALWKTLQSLHDADPSEWDATVSHNPEDAEFSFSLHGKAFYVIGMHPASSRMARQAPYTALTFNLHSQFEKLRSMGTYEKVRDMIRQNDKNLQGSINPVLKDFGDDSESRQYSGRNVEDAWKCPFHHKHN